MEKKEFQKRKDEILDKIFISSDEHIKLLQQKIAVLTMKVDYLRKELRVLKRGKKHDKDQILNAVGKIMREYEVEFEKTKEPLPETKQAFYEFFEKLDNELLEELFPDIAKQEFIQKQKKIGLFRLKLNQNTEEQPNAV